MKTPEEYEAEALDDQLKVAALFDCEEKKYKDKVLGEISYQLGKWKMYARLESIGRRNAQQRLRDTQNEVNKPIEFTGTIRSGSAEIKPASESGERQDFSHNPDQTSPVGSP